MIGFIIAIMTGATALLFVGFLIAAVAVEKYAAKKAEEKEQKK